MGNNNETPVALTIATSDSGAGAGIQADLLTFAANGVYGVTALAALTAQNPKNVSAIVDLKPDFLKQQLHQLDNFFTIGAVKIGMLYNEALIETVVSYVKKLDCPIVVDPVMVASSGARLLERDAQESLCEKLLPLAKLITPNTDEASILLDASLESLEDMRSGARKLASRYNTAVLLKGGHIEGDTVTDILMTKDGHQEVYEAPRIDPLNTHGSGCTLSSAIAANFAKGQQLVQAVSEAHAYLQAALHQPLTLSGERFLNHFPRR